MAELGEYAEKMHLELAAYAEQSAVNYFYFIGPYAQAMAAHVGENARAVDTKQELVDLILLDQCEQKTVLVKGSRSAAMDDVINMIKRRVQ